MKTVDTFLKIVQIPSHTMKENAFIRFLEEFHTKFDNKIIFTKQQYIHKEEQNYNIIVKIPATNKNKHAIFFDSHIDTVMPGENIKPIIENGIIKSSGGTILGADDKAGVAAMLCATDYIINNNIQRGDIYMIYTTAEEIRLVGAQSLDFTDIKADFGFVLDASGDIGGIITQAPFHYEYKITVYGKSVHAGIEPEKGVNAIKLVSNILKTLPQGRLSAKTTANIGLISGGKQTNIVADRCEIIGEFRSLDEKDIEMLKNKIIQVITNEKKKGINAILELTEEYRGFELKSNSPIVKTADKVFKSMKIKSTIRSTGGGSNANIYNNKGISTAVLAIGMKNAHSLDEYIKAEDLDTLKDFIIKAVSV